MSLVFLLGFESKLSSSQDIVVEIKIQSFKQVFYRNLI